MQASTSMPSVLARPAEISSSLSPLDVFGISSGMHERSDSLNRRQRIFMACQYCRHRKIRCCGGSPCRNCSRSARECEYAPVPEAVNRATREKKAQAKAARTTHTISPMTTYSPFFADTPVFEVPYIAGNLPPQSRPTHMSHRRSVSVPNFDAIPWSTPPSAPLLNSPAMMEPNQWMYNGWSTGPPVPQVAPFPSVLEQPPSQPLHSPYLYQQPYYYPHPSTPPESQNSSDSDLPMSWSTPNLHLRVPAVPASTPGHSRTPHSPVSPVYYSPHSTPPPYNRHHSYQPQSHLHPPQPMFSPSPLGQQSANASPTLAPAMNYHRRI